MALELSSTAAGSGSGPCSCQLNGHARFVVVTGGPGAGKTAVLELAKRRFCHHVHVLPEAATMLFGSGFPRAEGDAVRRAGQTAIYHVEVQLERATAALGGVNLGLCDRGTIDGVAYWPGSTESYFAALGTSQAAEYARYAAVIHMRTPSAAFYNHQNTVRVESAERAQRIDQRIVEAWAEHPRLHVIEPTSDFLDKARRVLDIMGEELQLANLVNSA